MDPNLLRHIEYFTVPNSQTVNPVDQTFNLTGRASARPPSTWDASALATEVSANESPPSAPTALSRDSLAQASTTAPTSLSVNTSARSSAHGQLRPTPPVRVPQAKDARERKRSRLGVDITPFDSVDYWIQFDNEESTPEHATAELLKTESKMAGSAASARRSLGTTLAPAPTGDLKFDDAVDDSALDNALSDDEDFSSMNLADHLSKIESAAPSEVPPREGLYSTPLSWERPQPGLRLDSLIGMQSPTLSEAEQRRLIAIAMNPGPTMGGLGSNLNMNFGMGLSSTSGPGLGTTTMSRVTDIPGQPGTLSEPDWLPEAEAKMSRSSSGRDKGKDKAKPGDRTAHNDIERKYRTNLKDKIAELRDAVPSLRTIPENAADEGEEEHPPPRAPKASKGTILTKATEYIHYLERRNKAILREHQELSRRLQAFEQLLNAAARPTFQMPNYSRTLFDPRAFC